MSSTGSDGFILSVFPLYLQHVFVLFRLFKQVLNGKRIVMLLGEYHLWKAWSFQVMWLMKGLNHRTRIHVQLRVLECSQLLPPYVYLNDFVSLHQLQVLPSCSVDWKTTCPFIFVHAKVCFIHFQKCLLIKCLATSPCIEHVLKMFKMKKLCTSYVWIYLIASTQAICIIGVLVTVWCSNNSPPYELFTC